MKLLTARLKHFKSFKGEQTFSFPQEPGLYFMRGINEVEPRLGGNGVGKTTLWDALLWVLFEKTARGLKAGDVCNWEVEKGTEVAFDFIEDDVQDCIWTVRRTWKPNTWTLSHDAAFITDEEVIDLTKDAANPVLNSLRLEFEPFLQAILMAQGRPMFLDLKQEPQAKLFSDVLGLERWMDYSSRASKAASAQDQVSRDLERAVSKLQGELSAVGSQDLAKSHDDWEIERMRKLLEVKADYDAGLEKRKKLNSAVEEAEDAVRVARLDVQENRVDETILARMEEKRQTIRELERELDVEAAALRAVRSHAHALNEQGICPTCGQGLSKEQRFDELGKAERAERSVSKLMHRLDDLLQTHRKELGDMAREVRDDEEFERQAREKLDLAQRALGDARRALDLKDRELARLEDRSEELEDEENPFAGMAREARQKAQEAREALGRAERSLDASQERYAMLSHWVRGFKEIRLQEIAEALTELEIEVNSAVHELGLVGWELSFAVDKEGKGGSLQRGFAVTVRSPHNPRATPWEAWSGGEGQRLRLAANMGLADLVRSRTGTSLDLEVWDEPTNGLSPEGIQDLLECLARRARVEQRQIWIVDHRAFDFGGFAGTATVVKAPSGSRIRTSWSYK